MSKLKPSIYTLKHLAGEDFPGHTEKSYLLEKLRAYAASLLADTKAQRLTRDFFLNPRISVFERAKKAGINISRH